MYVLPGVRSESMNSYSAPVDTDPLFGNEITVVAFCKLLVAERLTRKPTVSLSDSVTHWTLISVALAAGTALKSVKPTKASVVGANPPNQLNPTKKRANSESRIL